MHRYGILFLALILTIQGSIHAQRINGFNASIPVNKIMHGGPPRDGIPAIYNEHEQEIPSYISFWFACVAFHQQAEIFKAQ